MPLDLHTILRSGCYCAPERVTLLEQALPLLSLQGLGLQQSQVAIIWPHFSLQQAIILNYLHQTTPTATFEQVLEQAIQEDLLHLDHDQRMLIWKALTPEQQAAM